MSRNADLQRLRDLQKLQDLENELAAMSTVVEEMHPDISTADRAIIKNLSNASEEADPQNLEFLRQKYPNLEFGTDNGRILVRSPEEKDWKVIDPNTGFFSSDFARDALDIAAPIAQGAVEGAADTAGGAAGFLVGGPAGAVAGRAAAGGAAAGLTESLRQQLGKWAGVNQQVNPDDVKASAALSAAFPFAGTALKGAYRGATRVAAPYLAEMLSGVPREAIKTAFRRMDEIDDLDRGGVRGYALDVWDKVRNTIQKGLRDKGEELFQRIQEAKGLVDIEEAKQTIPKILREYDQMKGELNNPALESSIAELRSVYDDLFRYSEPKPLQDLIRNARNPKESIEILRSSKPRQVVRESSILDPGTGKPAQVTSFVVDEVPGKISPQAAWKLQKQIGYASDAAKLPVMPSAVSNRTAGKSDAGKDIVRALDESYGSIGNQLERVTGDGLGTSSKTLKQEYKEFADLARRADKYFPNEDRTYRNLTNLDKKSMRTMSDLITDLRNKFGLDVKKDTDLLQAHDFFGERYSALPSAPISTRGTTSTSRTAAGVLLGGAIGGIGGGNYGDSDEGGGGISKRNAILGSMLLGGIANPKTLKYALRGARQAEKFARTVNPGGVLTNYAPRAAFRLLNENAPSESSLYTVPSGWLGVGQ